jgi:flagellar operon protein
MSDPIRIQGKLPLPNTTPNANGVPNANPAPKVSFQEILRAKQGIAPGASAGQSRETTEAVRFSAHAQTRLQSRQIALEDGQLQRLDGAVQKAASKGARDALVLMDDLAMVVSVKNRTVVTVVDRENLRQNVFTNIDSAVIA